MMIAVWIRNLAHVTIGVGARVSRGLQQLGGCRSLQSPQTRAKPLFFGQKLNFSGRSQQPKMKKSIPEIRDFY